MCIFVIKKFPDLNALSLLEGTNLSLYLITYRMLEGLLGTSKPNDKLVEDAHNTALLSFVFHLSSSANTEQSKWCLS